MNTINLVEKKRKRDDTAPTLYRRANVRARSDSPSVAELEANWPQAKRAPQSSDLAARDFGVSGRTVRRAGFVMKHGIPELIAAVREGRVAVSAAENVAREPVEFQRRVMALVLGDPAPLRVTRGEHAEDEQMAGLIFGPGGAP